MTHCMFPRGELLCTAHTSSLHVETYCSTYTMLHEEHIQERYCTVQVDGAVADWWGPKKDKKQEHDEICGFMNNLFVQVIETPGASEHYDFKHFVSM